MLFYLGVYLLITSFCMFFCMFMSLLHFYDGDHRIARKYVDNIYWCLVWPVWAVVTVRRKNDRL